MTISPLAQTPVGVPVAGPQTLSVFLWAMNLEPPIASSVLLKFGRYGLRDLGSGAG
jgi:hypothetical protein